MPARKSSSSHSVARRSQSSPAPQAGRPYMPGYGLPTDNKGLLPWKWVEQRLTKSHNYWIATVTPAGAPHLMVVWGIWVDSVFYFSTGRKSRKARNLAANPKCVIGNDLSHEAAILEGTVVEVTDPVLLKRLSLPYEKKYPPWKLDPSMGPIFAVHPTVVFGLAERTFMQAATRWKFAAQTR